MDTLRFLIELFPPAQVWIPGLGALAAFMLVARYAARWEWPSPVGVSVVLTAAAVVAIAFLVTPTAGPAARDGLGDARVEYAALFVGTMVFLGLAGAAFTALRNEAPVLQVAGTILAGALALPVGMFAMLYLACVFNLGCV